MSIVTTQLLAEIPLISNMDEKERKLHHIHRDLLEAKTEKVPETSFIDV
jgi:hypothetical protein